MKKFTCLIIIILTTFLSLIKDKALAQQPIDLPCVYEDPCIIIGYESVEPIAGTNDLLVTMSYQIGCATVTRISITPVKAGNVQINAGEYTLNEVTIIEFIVNSNTFYKNNQREDSRLRIQVQFSDRPNVHIDLQFTTEEDCQAINPLPVELTSFKGKATESGISLQWETASELNNSHFEIERSSDGKSFSGIGKVQGRGTTSTKSNYSYSDKLPQNGTNYYRLKQVDYDNAHSYSSTIAVKWNAGDAMQAVMLPNPCANRNCNLTISNAANQATLIQLKDATGRIVFSKTIRSDSHLFELPMHELPQLKGLYFLTATTGNQVVHQRVVLE